MTDHNDLPTVDDQWADYRNRKATFDTLMELWISGGRLGPPPPQPVPPHTPGWLPPADIIPRSE